MVGKQLGHYHNIVEAPQNKQITGLIDFAKVPDSFDHDVVAQNA